MVELRPQASLLPPVAHGCDGLEFAKDDRIAAALRPGQEEDGFLNVRRQMQEIHDLADTGLRHMAQAGQLRNASCWR